MGRVAKQGMATYSMVKEPLERADTVMRSTRGEKAGADEYARRNWRNQQSLGMGMRE